MVVYSFRDVSSQQLHRSTLASAATDTLPVVKVKCVPCGKRLLNSAVFNEVTVHVIYGRFN